MRFLLTQEQQLIDDSLERVLADMARAGTATDSSVVWRQLAELGVLGAALPESVGGLGGGPVEQGLIAARLGRHLASCPYLSCAVVSSYILQHAETDLATEYLSRVVDGEARVALAVYEQRSRYSLDSLQTALSQTPDGLRLSGSKHYVLDGGAADVIIVVANHSDGSLSLVLVDPTLAGVTVTPYESVDGSPLATIQFAEVAVADQQIILRADDAKRVLNDALVLGAFAISADILGVCEAALEQTVAYLKVREQFGKALHTFQALQHRASDLHAEIEMLRSLVLGSAQTLSAGIDAQSSADALAAVVMAAEVGDHVGREAIQMHGAVGMTADLGVGRYLMRANTLTRLFGDVDDFRDRYLQTIEEVNA